MLDFLKKPIVISALAILIVGSIGGGILYKRHNSQFNEKTNSEGGASQTTATDGTKLKEDGTPITSTNPGSQSSQSNSGQKSTVKPTITSASQNGAVVSIRATTTQEGTCRVVFEQAGQPKIERSAASKLVTSYYICQGFDLESNIFPAKGKWDVRIYFSSASSEGVSDVTTMVIN